MIQGTPGKRPEGLRSWPGISRGAPGASRRLLNRSQHTLGSPRDHFFERPFRRAIRRRTPQRFLIEFEVVRGRVEARFAAQGQCFVRFGLFSSERLVVHQIMRINDPQTTPERQNDPRTAPPSVPSRAKHCDQPCATPSASVRWREGASSLDALPARSY